MFKSPGNGHIFQYITSGISAITAIFGYIFSSASFMTVVGFFTAMFMIISITVTILRRR